MATSVAEAEAHIATAGQRFWKRAIKLWIDIHTLSMTNPLRSLTSRIRKFRRMHRSPFRQVADALGDMPLENLETVNLFTLAPWEERVVLTATTRKGSLLASSPVGTCKLLSAAQRGTVWLGLVELSRSQCRYEEDRSWRPSPSRLA